MVDLVRQHYVDFGSMLAREKLLERHDVHVGRETLRKWMAAAGIWLPRRAQRSPLLRPFIDAAKEHSTR